MYKLGLKLWSTNTENYLKPAKILYSDGIFDYIELYVVPNTLDLLDKWRTVGSPFVIHNAHFAHGFNLAKSELKNKNLEIFLQTCRFADTLKAEHIIFHGGIDGCIEQTIEQMASLGESRALIENKPFIALPNRMGGKFCRGSTFAELEIIIKQTGCGFCLDFGHAVCSANSQGLNPYTFIEKLQKLSPTMYHLSGISDITSVYDDHPHLDSNILYLKRLKASIIPDNALISLETKKSFQNNLDDFIRDIEILRNA